jgi:hypothetical protein
MDELTMFASLRPDPEALPADERAALRVSLFGSSADGSGADPALDAPTSSADDPESTLIALEPRRPRSGARRRARRVGHFVVAIAVAAAVVTTMVLSSGEHATAPADTPISVPTAPEPLTGTLVDGDIRLTYTIPEGWQNSSWGPFAANSDPNAGTIMMPVANIFSDPCQSVEVDPPPGPTVDDLVAAFASVPALNVTPATDVTVDGFHGQQIEFTVPDYNEDECKNGHFGLFQYAEDAGLGPSYWAQRPHQYLRLWILDIAGTRYVVAGTYYPETPQQERDDLETVFNSIRIEPILEAETSTGSPISSA